MACSDDDGSPKQPSDPNKLQGLYAAWTVDVLGICGGLCWTTHYFFEDGTMMYAAGTHDMDWSNPKCEGSDCRTYTISDGKITIEGKSTLPFERPEDGKIVIGNTKFTYVAPAGDIKLNALYNSFNHISTPDGGGAGANIYLQLNSDGSYWERGTGFGYSEGGTAIDTQVHEGTYLIHDYYIQFTTEGKSQKLMFFLPEGRSNDINGSPKMIHIGTRDYLQED